MNEETCEKIFDLVITDYPIITGSENISKEENDILFNQLEDKILKINNRYKSYAIFFELLFSTQLNITEMQRYSRLKAFEDKYFLEGLCR
jgi:hypothetical protein